MSIDPFEPMGPIPGGSGPTQPGAGSPEIRTCEACGGSITGPEIYGSGRFCSQLCAKLRTKDNHWNWLVEHPDELEKWQKQQKDKKKRQPIHRNLPL